jgi:hypothetical protein
VLGLYGLLLHLGGAVGGLVIGILTDDIGIGPALALAGGIVLALTAAIAPRVLAAQPPSGPVGPGGDGDDH